MNRTDGALRSHPWARVAGAVAMAAGAAVFAAGCRGDGEGAGDVVERAFDAVSEPEMVFRARGDDGSEVWADVERRLFRLRDGEADGGLTSIGEGWERTYYDPFSNQVMTESNAPPGDRPPRINHPVIQWLEPLGAIAYAPELTLIGRTMSDGREVVALEARSPVMEEGEFTGSYLVGRVELDPVTYVVVAFERRVDLPAGETPAPDGFGTGQQPKRVRYQTEFVPRYELPEGFFDPSMVEGQVITLEGSLGKISEMGIELLWLGERYEGAGGVLRLAGETDGVIVDQVQGEASFHYGLELGQDASVLLSESVVVRLGVSGTEFGPPAVQEFAGNLPEAEFGLTVRGEEVVARRSLITPSDLPCPAGNCPETDTPLFHRVTFTVGETVVQVETFARIDSVTGVDQNGYNSPEGIALLAEALSAGE